MAEMRLAVRMCRSLAMALLLSCASLALASSVNLQINDPPSNNVLDGIYVGAYSATNTVTQTNTQIICDDFRDESNYNAANYTINTFSNLNNTLWGPGAATLYKEAAWLTLGMLGQTGVKQGYYSYAIWATFDPTDVLSWLKNYNDSAACNAVFGNNCTSTNASSGSLLYAAQQNYGSGDYSNFLILTPTLNCGQPGSCAEQEFFELVPEGGSALAYLLLASFSCFGAILYSRRRAASFPA